MTLDVAGVLCQDLNRPANVLVVVSLDVYRPVISQRNTERYPTERCSELCHESSLAPVVIAATGADGATVTDDANTRTRICAFQIVKALRVNSIPFHTGYKLDTSRQLDRTTAFAALTATLALATADTSAALEVVAAIATLSLATAAITTATFPVNIVFLYTATTTLHAAINSDNHVRIDRTQTTYMDTGRIATLRLHVEGPHFNPPPIAPPHTPSKPMPQHTLTSAMNSSVTLNTLNSNTPITQTLPGGTRLDSSIQNIRQLLFACKLTFNYTSRVDCRLGKSLTLLFSFPPRTMEVSPDGTTPKPPDIPMEPTRKRRTAPAGQLEHIRAAINMVEIALIFDTSDGKKGAYGGLGETNARTRDSVERTMTSIIAATLPGVQFEQCRVDQISVYKEPSFFIILLVTQAIADATLGATNGVFKLIDYTIAGATPEDEGKPRVGVSIVVTTPSQIPKLAMFGGRTDTSIPAGEPAPGIQVVMYIQDTRELRINDPSMRFWSMEELMKDIDNVLTDERQPLTGYRTQTIPDQPTRLSPKTPGGVAVGISLKFWLIAPIHPRDPASISGVLLPAPILLPLKIVEDPAGIPNDPDPEFISVWTNDPRDPMHSNMTRAERCQGGKHNAGDGVSVRYVVNGVRGTMVQDHNGEQFWRAGDDADEELDATHGLTSIASHTQRHSASHRNQLRKNAANAQTAKIDKECIKAHKLAQAMIYFSTGVCDEAIKRLSTRDSITFVPADRAMAFASRMEIPSEVLNAACRSDKCKKNMCISLNLTAAAILTARTEGRAKTAAIIETARLNEEISSVIPSPFPPRMEPRNPGQSSRTPPHASKGGTSTAPLHAGTGSASIARPPTQAARLSHPKAPMATAKPPEEHRYEAGGTEAYTQAEFFAYFGNHRQWEAA